MKSLLKENINLNLKFPEEDNPEKIIDDVLFDFYKNKIEEDVNYYNKIPSKHKTKEIKDMANIIFTNQLKTSIDYIVVPIEFRTKENLLSEMKQVVYFSKEKNIEEINFVYKRYPEEAKTEENIAFFIQNGGNLKYINRKKLSTEMWKVALKQNNENILFLPEKTYFAEIVRIVKMLFIHYTARTILTILFSLFLLFLLVSFFIGGISLIIFLLIWTIKIIAVLFMIIIMMTFLAFVMSH